jgi:hypothetical protein
VFGTILTRLRTQLGNKALLNIAELKLYLREEHLQARSVQTRLKRTFSTAVEEDAKLPNPLASLTAPPTAPPTNVSTSTTTADEDSQPAPAADVFMAHTSPTPCGSSAANSVGQLGMHRIVQELIEAVDTDNDLDELPDPCTDVLSIPIRDLFDFTQLYWVEAYDKLAMRGLQDELELYELLDLDADGDTVENEADDTLNE